MHLFLIGNGNCGRNNTPNELEPFDRVIVAKTNKEKPNFLFIGLASSFSDSYYDLMKKNYKSLGCNIFYLKKSNLINNPDIVKEKIESADIIYFGGGDSKKLYDSIKEFNLEPLLRESKAILVGISAGANVLCSKGLSDYEIDHNISNNYVFLDGLSFININLCPHGEEEKRLADIELNKDIDKVLILPTNTMLEIDDNKCTCYSIDDKYIYLKDKNKIIKLDKFDLDSII